MSPFFVSSPIHLLFLKCNFLICEGNNKTEKKTQKHGLQAVKMVFQFKNFEVLQFS